MLGLMFSGNPLKFKTGLIHEKLRVIISSYHKATKLI